MNEFLFPPSRIPPVWIIPIHVAFVSVILASLVAFIWRLRRPAKFDDIIGWAFVFGGTVVLCNVCYSDEVLRSNWVRYTRLIGYLGFYAVVVAVLRTLSPKGSTFTALARGLLCVLPPAVLLEFALAAGCILPVDFGAQRVAWDRGDCKNRMKELMIGLHNYEYTNRYYPPPEVQTDELPPRSWRVELLPWLGVGPLRKSYSNNDQWNGSQNSTLSQLMPYELACPANPRTVMALDGVEWQTTGYAMVKGPHAFGTSTGRKVSDFRDGITNTVAIVEASGRMIPWLKPEDVEPTPETSGINTPGVAAGRSRGMISSYHPGGAHIAMADGSVRFFNERVDPKILQAILTADGGETPGEF